MCEPKAIWSALPSATGGCSRCLSMPCGQQSIKPKGRTGGSSSPLTSARSFEDRQQWFCPRSFFLPSHKDTTAERMGGESKEDSWQDHSAGAPSETDVHSIWSAPPQHTWALSWKVKGAGTCPYSQARVWTLLASTGAGLAQRSADNSRADFVVVSVDVPQLLIHLHLFNDKLLPGSTLTSCHICPCGGFFFTLRT